MYVCFCVDVIVMKLDVIVACVSAKANHSKGASSCSCTKWIYYRHLLVTSIAIECSIAASQWHLSKESKCNITFGLLTKFLLSLLINCFHLSIEAIRNMMWWSIEMKIVSFDLSHIENLQYNKLFFFFLFVHKKVACISEITLLSNQNSKIYKCRDTFCTNIRENKKQTV